jgi:RNA polymerase sigma-70 factor (ECF subfamily)
MQAALLHIQAANDDAAASDETLIRRIATGDRPAMQSLYATHRLRVYRYLLRLVRDRETAEDLVSEVFLDVWRQAGRFQGRSAVSTWLLAIARYKALSTLRQASAETKNLKAAVPLMLVPDDPEVATRKHFTDEILRRCLTALPPNHSEIIDLVYYQGKSIREIAQIVSIPENTVKTRMFHARQRLAKMLTGAGVDHAAA